jgi:superfamily II DNA or RNA helicase
MQPKHSSARRFLTSGLFDDLESFEGLESRISLLPTGKDRGDAFEVFAEAYVATQKICQALNVWPFESLPLVQRNALGLDTLVDMGVDGVYESHSGEFYAYQVKFRSNRSSLTWDELSTFMGLTDQCKWRVLITNCESLPALMRDRNGFVAIRGSDLDRLTRDDFAVIRSWLQSGQVVRHRKTPLKHQQEALHGISTHLDTSDRATVVMACGTGKTLVALWTAESRQSKRVLFLAPSLALIRQSLHEWLKETSWDNLAFLCVCSDPTVARGTDDLVIRQSDLDFPVTTDSAVVRQFLTQTSADVLVVFSTYQSAHVVAEGMASPFDLGIFDEAHKTATRTGVHFSFALDDKSLPIQKRLFFTATPRHYDLHRRDKAGDGRLVYSMDSPEIYGPVAYTLSFAEAARRGIICDYKIVISLVTSGMINEELLKRSEVLVEGQEVDAHKVALQIALQKAAERFCVKRIFTFHGTVAAALSFTSADSEGVGQHLAGFSTLHVNGAMPTAARENQMKEFRLADKAVMSNSRCLTEGVDVPAVDMVAFMSPRKSKVDIVQATGRAMRKSPGKEMGYVLVPLFLEQAAGETIDESLLRTGFGDVWEVLAALKEQDEVLADVIQTMRVEKGQAGEYDQTRFSERVEILGPTLSLAAIRDSVVAQCVEYLTCTWDERYGELKAYLAKYGDMDIGKNVAVRGGYELAAWVAQQRYRRRCPLTAERRRLLDEIGFVWIPDAYDKGWGVSFEELLSYRAKFGNTNVPQSWPENPKLGRWVYLQRARFKDRKLSDDKIRRLDAIGFNWDFRLKTTWDEMYTALVDFQRLNGHCEVPEELPGSLTLSNWVKAQRSYRRTLDKERCKLLDGVGFCWNSRRPGPELWDKHYAELLEFKKAHGHCRVPDKWAANQFLATWVEDQRKAKKENQLNPERQQALSDLGFAWDPWDEIFAALLEYHKQHGDCDVPFQWQEDVELARWVYRQRVLHRTHKLRTDYVVRLNSVGFIWGTQKTKKA